MELPSPPSDAHPRAAKLRLTVVPGKWGNGGVSTSTGASETAELSTSPVQVAAPAAAPRVLELDILRGVAILLVLGIHSPGTRGESGRLRPLDIFIHKIGWKTISIRAA